MYKKANSTLAFKTETCICVSVTLKSLIYLRPPLEYAVCFWAPHRKCNTDKLESVQQ